MNKKITLALIAIGAAFSQSQANLILNGDFETGTFANWTVVNQGSGNFFIDAPGTPTPESGFATAPNGAGGSFYAVTAQPGPGAHALLQSFTIAPGQESLSLTFQMFANNNNNAGAPIIHPAGLDHTAEPNQHARVDILSGSATPFDTGAGVVQNLYIGSDLGTNPHPYTNYVFNLTLAPGTYQLRFAEVDNVTLFNLGVDNVSLNATNGVPDAGSTLALLGMAAGVLLAATRFRRDSVPAP